MKRSELKVGMEVGKRICNEWRANREPPARGCGAGMSERMIVVPRMLVVVSCEHCPSRDHKGAWGNVSRIPVCRATGISLPYTAQTDGIGNRVEAIPTYVIPEWCPLPQVSS